MLIYISDHHLKNRDRLPSHASSYLTLEQWRRICDTLRQTCPPSLCGESYFRQRHNESHGYNGKNENNKGKGRRRGDSEERKEEDGHDGNESESDIESNTDGEGERTGSSGLSIITHVCLCLVEILIALLTGCCCCCVICCHPALHYRLVDFCIDRRLNYLNKVMFDGYQVLDHYEHAIVIDTTHLEVGGTTVSPTHRIAGLVDSIGVVDVENQLWKHIAASGEEKHRENDSWEGKGYQSGGGIRGGTITRSAIFSHSISNSLSQSHSHSLSHSRSYDQRENEREPMKENESKRDDNASTSSYSPPSPYQGFRDGDGKVMVVKIPATNTTDDALFAVRDTDGSIRTIKVPERIHAGQELLLTY